MPFLKVDPWRKQYFDPIQCPEDVMIPLKDPDGYRLNPKHNWLYNKLVIAELQNLPCGPHGTPAINYPVFSKPIYNLRSMGAGIQVINNEEQYHHLMKGGYMWCQLLKGDHISTDFAVVNGKVVWLVHAKGHPLQNGTFDYWEIINNVQNYVQLTNWITKFVETHLIGYTGMLNLETIGGKIIEAQLRFADQWPDLYGKGFLEEVVKIYSKKSFQLDPSLSSGYSVTLFSEPRLYKKPNKQIVQKLIKIPGISSIQFSFHEDQDPKLHSMPPGGILMAIINGFDLKNCQKVKELLRRIMVDSEKYQNLVELQGQNKTQSVKEEVKTVSDQKQTNIQ